MGSVGETVEEILAEEDDPTFFESVIGAGMQKSLNYESYINTLERNFFQSQITNRKIRMYKYVAMLTQKRCT